MDGWQRGDEPSDDGAGAAGAAGVTRPGDAASVDRPAPDVPVKDVGPSGVPSDGPAAVIGMPPATVGDAVGALLARRGVAQRPARAAAASLTRLATMMNAPAPSVIDGGSHDGSGAVSEEGSGGTGNDAGADAPPAPTLASALAPRGLGARSAPRHDAAMARGDDAIDAPPQVGTDERRMQVRAYNFWAALLGDRQFPAIVDLTPDTLSDFGPHGVLLDFTDGIDNPAVRFIGSRLREECGIDTDVQRIDDVPSRSLLSRLTDHYLQIIANRAPIGFEAEYVNQRGATIMYRGILLPFSSDDATIDFIFGVINWKEAVPGVVRDGLEAEVANALRVAAAPSPGGAAAIAPVWADGPAGSALAALGARGAAGGPADTDMGYDADTGPLGLSDAVDAAEPAAQPGELLSDPGEDASLADWLAIAREEVAIAEQAATRTRGALYAAVARAHDFATIAGTDPGGLAELYADAGIKPQARAPMTPLVKLVFGAGYDKTRLTEYATVLTHAAREGVPRGALSPYLQGYAGGLKALVRDERARRRAGRAETPAVDALAAARDRLAQAPGMAHIALPADGGDGAGIGDWVVLLARRDSIDAVAVVAAVDADAALLDRVVRRARIIAEG